MTSTSDAPRVFVSYSHDIADHKEWVLTLATRLVANGVDVVLDQWDLRLGGDLPRFRESGLTESRRVLAVCTAAYVTKANEGLGGVGYEKMILTAQLMQDVTTDRILPIVKDNTLVPALPTFLGSRVYVDFRQATQFEAKFTELLGEIHGQPILPRPPLGPNPFTDPPLQPVEPVISTCAGKYVNPSLNGTVTFDYSDNNGRFVIVVLTCHSRPRVSRAETARYTPTTIRPASEQSPSFSTLPRSPRLRTRRAMMRLRAIARRTSERSSSSRTRPGTTRPRRSRAWWLGPGAMCLIDSRSAIASRRTAVLRFGMPNSALNARTFDADADG
jgi:hypothetical protein